jgi:hypothetical protein
MTQEGNQTENLDELVAGSRKEIFMLQTDKEALDFWREPARAKIVTIYMQKCGWCHRFVREFIKLAPTKANSDLLFGSVSRNHIDKVIKFIPSLNVQGFPTTLLVGPPPPATPTSMMTVRHVIPGYMTPHALVDLLEAKFPEIKDAPTLKYLQDVKRESLAAEQAKLAATTQPTISNSAQLPSRVNLAAGTATPPPNLIAAPIVIRSASLASASTSASLASAAIPPDVTAGSGTAGDHALPPHLRQGGTSITQPVTTPAAAAAAAAAAATAAGGRVGVKGMSTVGGRKHKSKHRHHHHHHRRVAGGSTSTTTSTTASTTTAAAAIGGAGGDENSDATNDKPTNSRNTRPTWCTIL